MSDDQERRVSVSPKSKTVATKEPDDNLTDLSINY